RRIRYLSPMSWPAGAPAGAAQSAASGGPMLPRLYCPERSKQQARRLPDASMSQPDAMRFTRVSAFLPDVIHWIQSRRARGVMSSQVAFAAGFAASALRRSGGTVGSGSTATGATPSATVSPAFAPAASSSVLGTFSQWLPAPSGSSVAWKGASPKVPATVTWLRVGSFALAAAGSTRKAQVAFFGCAGRWRSALNRMAPSRIDDPGTLAPRHDADQVDAGAASSTTPAPAAVRRAASAPLRSL